MVNMDHAGYVVVVGLSLRRMELEGLVIHLLCSRVRDPHHPTGHPTYACSIVRRNLVQVRLSNNTKGYNSIPLLRGQSYWHPLQRTGSHNFGPYKPSCCPYRMVSQFLTLSKGYCLR